MFGQFPDWFVPVEGFVVEGIVPVDGVVVVCDCVGVVAVVDVAVIAAYATVPPPMAPAAATAARAIRARAPILFLLSVGNGQLE
jgi:hypothetical protein